MGEEGKTAIEIAKDDIVKDAVEKITKKKENKLKVLCVRTGDKYFHKYVTILYAMCKIYIKIPFDFICYTDDKDCLNIKSDSPIHYKRTDKSGWWGKVDIFENKGPCLFFDLDTIIVDDITDLAKSIFKLKNDNVLMIKPWIQKGWASGIMAWNGSFDFVKNDFVTNDKYSFKWDQRYITYKLREYSVDISAIQDKVSLCSYKHHCRSNVLYPKGTQIVCFHGRPNPHEVKDKWVKEYWR